MFTVFWFVFWTGLTVLAFAAGVSLRGRLLERVGRRWPLVDDAAVEEILETGTLTTDEDEPLDIEEIDEQERKFWSESWDEPDEW